MAITFKDSTFDVVDNGDGTFTLTPTAATPAEALIVEYRSLREEAKTLIAHRDQVVAKIQDLRDRRDALKLLLETAGNTPDEDLVE
jgi:hypothetical protein